MGQDARAVRQEVRWIDHLGLKRHILTDPVAVLGLDRLPLDFGHDHPRCRHVHSACRRTHPQCRVSLPFWSNFILSGWQDRFARRAGDDWKQAPGRGDPGGRCSSPGLATLCGGRGVTARRDGPGQEDYRPLCEGHHRQSGWSQANQDSSASLPPRFRPPIRPPRCRTVPPAAGRSRAGRPGDKRPDWRRCSPGCRLVGDASRSDPRCPAADPAGDRPR